MGHDWKNSGKLEHPAEVAEAMKAALNEGAVVYETLPVSPIAVENVVVSGEAVKEAPKKKVKAKE